MRQILDRELDGIREAGTWKHERIITSPQGSSIQVTGRSDQILNFCANNYLGLSVGSQKYLFVFHSNTRQTALTLGVFYSMPRTPNRTISFFLRKIGGYMSFCGATDTPVLDFWWHLLWVSKPEWAALFTLGGGMCDVYSPVINLWYDTCQPLDGQYGGAITVPHVCFSRGRIPATISFLLFGAQLVGTCKKRSTSVSVSKCL